MTVYRVGEQYLLVDGFHRVPAHVEAGRVSIQAEVHEGSRDDAEWHSRGVNNNHGLRQTNRDKRKNVSGALKQRPDLSDQLIADHCGVSRTFVLKLRGEMSPTCHGDTLESRVGKDGKTRPATRSAKPADDEPLVDPPEEHDDDPQDDDETALLQSEVDELAEPYKRAVNDLLRIKRDMPRTLVSLS